MPLSNKQPCGLPIGRIVSLGNAELEGVKLEEQVVGNSFKLTNERCFLTDVPLPAVNSLLGSLPFDNACKGSPYMVVADGILLPLF